MVRNWKSYEIQNKKDFRNKLLRFASSYGQFIFYDSCDNHIYGLPSFDFLLAAGCKKYIQLKPGNAFETLRKFIDQNDDWCFGYFGYDLKNEIENLTSSNFDGIGFEEMVFFIPELIVLSTDNKIKIGTVDFENDAIFYAIETTDDTGQKYQPSSLALQQRITRENYLRKIELLKQHIIAGDVYEVNLCQEFYAENVVINPGSVFNSLCDYSKAPFSCLMKWNDNYLISASPERFLQKKNRKVISQPMKGTMARGKTKDEDIDLKQQLTVSEKDIAENIMIVDLMRNDLTRYAKTGTIRVEELFEIYSFEQVHQMVSTISAELRENAHIVDVIRNAFPIGSMTGAPKVMAMELIEKYEETKRGLFSGAVGYITPEKDFDFNVVIRSILYSTAKKYVSLQTGGAIVYDSDGEKEYEESILKAEALMRCLNIL